MSLAKGLLVFIPGSRQWGRILLEDIAAFALHGGVQHLLRRGAREKDNIERVPVLDTY